LDEIILNAIFEDQLRNPNTLSAYFIHIVAMGLVQLQVYKSDSTIKPFDFNPEI
jgi:hypothetical protein